MSRCRSSVVRPGRRPSSRSAWRTHFRSVSAVQPIFSAIEVIAAHCESCPASCSTTSRTAPARTSGENRFGLAMAPSSQGLEPPGDPGRFKLLAHLGMARFTAEPRSSAARVRGHHPLIVSWHGDAVVTALRGAILLLRPAHLFLDNGGLRA